MQYHYVVGYDSDKDRWFVESDSVSDDGSFEQALDQKCLNMLQSLVPIWPSPLVNGEL